MKERRKKTGKGGEERKISRRKEKGKERKKGVKKGKGNRGTSDTLPIIHPGFSLETAGGKGGNTATIASILLEVYLSIYI